MPRDGTGQKYTLKSKIHFFTDLDGRTPAEKAILFYLRIRELEKQGGATQATIIEDTKLSERTVGTAVRKLVKTNLIG